MPVSTRTHRRGSATLWMVIWLPCLLVLFCTLVGVANLWLARVELETALESAALAAVKQWGDQGGGETLAARECGAAYAQANCARGSGTVIGLNYDPIEGGPNQNEACAPSDHDSLLPTGSLVFGAIDDSDPDHVVFNAGVAPSCAACRVLIDASASGSGNLASDNAWGISFFDTSETNSNLRISRIVIDLRGSGGVGQFLGPAVLSDNLPQPAVHDQSGNSQPDNVGFSDLANQVQFSYPAIGKLQIDFLPDNDPSGGTDDGFAPGDRFRFGQDVGGVSRGSGLNDGDGIGRTGTTVTIYFSMGGSPLPPLTGVSGTMLDNTERSNDCFDPALVSASTGTLVVHPALVPDLPCPPTSATNNNGQSYVLINAEGEGKFGVRAQAIVSVAPLGGLPFVGSLSKYCVQAKATAEYDCLTRRVRLVRVDEYVCPGP